MKHLKSLRVITAGTAALAGVAFAVPATASADAPPKTTVNVSTDSSSLTAAVARKSVTATVTTPAGAPSLCTSPIILRGKITAEQVRKAFVGVDVTDPSTIPDLSAGDAARYVYPKATMVGGTVKLEPPVSMVGVAALGVPNLKPSPYTVTVPDVADGDYTVESGCIYLYEPTTINVNLRHIHVDTKTTGGGTGSVGNLFGSS